MTTPGDEQTLAETAELLLYGQWHEDWQVPLAEWFLWWLEMLKETAWIFDVENVDPSWLPVLAVLFHADAYVAGIYDVEYERRTILEAAYLNRLRGKPAAIDHFAQLAGFEIYSEYTFNGVRVSGVDLYVTPSVGSNQSDAEWQAYVSKVCTALMKIWLDINRVIIAQRFAHETRFAADYAAFDWVPTPQGIEVTYSLL